MVLNKASTTEETYLAMGDNPALRNAPVTHRRVGRDAGTKQRGGPGEVDVGRDAQNEAFIHNDAVGVAAVGDRRRLVFVGRAVGEH